MRSYWAKRRHRLWEKWEAYRASAYFDADWYLQTYPDVAVAGIDAWRHFDRHGRYEGRVPCAAHAAIWLERDPEQPTLGQLSTLLQQGNRKTINYAAWTLGRWFAVDHEWSRVHDNMQYYRFGSDPHAPLRSDLMPAMLWVDALRLTGRTQQAQQFIENLPAAYTTTETALAQVNLLRGVVESQAWLAPLNDIYRTHGLLELTLEDHAAVSLDQLTTVQPPEHLGECSTDPLVSIIIPAYNAGRTLATAIGSLQRQTWQHVEIIVVDDASSDDTVAIVTALSTADPRIRLITQDQNRGAYATRNVGLRHARGDFITVHDSDDWSHPQKIHKQLETLMAHPKQPACLSHWVRVSTELEFGSWQTHVGWAGWCHRNTSSLMFRREVFNTLGYWDRVSCNADTEYCERIRRVFGAQAVQEVLPGVPLALGRTHPGSLTRQSATSIFSIFGGFRQDYEQAYRAWHGQSHDMRCLYLPEHPQQRPFPAPEAMVLKPKVMGHS